MESVVDVYALAQDMDASVAAELRKAHAQVARANIAREALLVLLAVTSLGMAFAGAALASFGAFWEGASFCLVGAAVIVGCAACNPGCSGQ